MKGLLVAWRRWAFPNIIFIPLCWCNSDSDVYVNVFPSLSFVFSPPAYFPQFIIFDLLPQVYRKAYNPGNNVIQIEFKVEKKGKKTAAGHFGKAVKGRFIRYLADNQISNIKDFSGFEYDGFKWADDHFVKVIN